MVSGASDRSPLALCCWPAAHLAAPGDVPGGHASASRSFAWLGRLSSPLAQHRWPPLARLCLYRSRSAYHAPAPCMPVARLLACLPSRSVHLRPTAVHALLPPPAGATHRRRGPPVIPLGWIHSPAKSGTEFGRRQSVRQANAPAGEAPLEWMLLTSEPVSTKRDARCVVESYESRWLIEEFHKAWKSGCRIEQRRLQSPANLERMLVLTAHIAVRLLQLRSLTKEDPERPCDAFLAEDEWKCLHATTHPNQPVPQLPPTCEWALRSIAMLGGWRDTKGTGKIGWMALWKGWQRFQERLAGWSAAVRSLYG
jgi:hypothetical protein